MGGKISVLGVLGGMGPAATLDFLEKLLKLRNAETDQDQIPTLTYNNTQIPDRNEAYLRNGESPVPELRRSAQVLERAGVDLIAMPCNTAHIWFSDIQSSVSVKILNMPELTATEIENSSVVGIISTTPVRVSGLYAKPLEEKGATVLYSNSQEDIMHAIYNVKAGKLEEARKEFLSQIKALESRGATHILAACTEVPVVVSAVDIDSSFIDPMESLAMECIRKLSSGQADNKHF